MHQCAAVVACKCLLFFAAAPILAMLVGCGGGGFPSSSTTAVPPAAPTGTLPVTMPNDDTIRSGKATIVISRKSNLIWKTSWDIYLNDQKVQGIGDGGRITVSFTPRSGKNNLYLVQNANGHRTESKTLLFDAIPNGTYRFSCEINVGWVNSIVLNREDSEGVYISDLSIALNPTPSSVETETEKVTVVQGVKSTLKRSRTIQHTVNITKNESDYKSISGSLEVIKGEIKSKVEVALSQGLTLSETVERTHEFDGREGGVYKLIWVEYFREGTATVNVQGTTLTIPFKIRVGADLTVEKVR
jgi:hypothetical protein